MAVILVVDDEPNIRRMLASLLTAEGHRVETAADGASGLVAVDERLLARLDRAVWRQLETYRRLHLLALPSGEPSPPGITARARIADLIRQAIGYHITFAGEEA